MTDDIASGTERRDTRWVPRIKIRVDLFTFDGEVYEGYIFLSPDMRPLDALNAFTAFMPFEKLDGELEIISKRAIKRLTPYDKPAYKRLREGELVVNYKPDD